MPGFSTEVPHQLGRDEATERLKNFVERVREHYKDQVSNLQGEWVDHTLEITFTTYGFGIEALVEVLDDVVKLTGKLPFAAVAFRGKIEQSIASELKKVLA